MKIEHVTIREAAKEVVQVRKLLKTKKELEVETHGVEVSLDHSRACSNKRNKKLRIYQCDEQPCPFYEPFIE